MTKLGYIERRIYLRFLRWKIVAQSHPVRTQAALAILAALLFTYFSWRYLTKEVPLWINKVSTPIFHAMQAHPAFGRFVHVLINAVPDFAFALLAVAGLGYLAPGVIKKLEEMRRVRVFLVLFFTFFGVAAIVINAVNRESQEFKDTQNDDRMGLVLKDVTGIQEGLNPNATNMSEAKRKEYRLSALRDEYILTQNPVDPLIVAGSKMPPEAWMNQRLEELGESWRVKDAPLPQPTSSQVIQLPEQEKKPKVVFSFYKPDMTSEPDTVKIDSGINGEFHFSIGAIVIGDVPAKNLQIWIRECKACEWTSPEPPGFAPVDPDHPFDRAISVPEFQPNVATPKWSFAVKIPPFPRTAGISIACYYSCTNCGPVDWKKPQVLWITPTIAGLRQLSPSIVYTPEPVQK